MMLLLDTHAVLWFWWADGRLSAAASAVICDPANRKLVSPATAWEVAIWRDLVHNPIGTADVNWDERPIPQSL